MERVKVWSGGLGSWSAGFGPAPGIPTGAASSVTASPYLGPATGAALPGF
jgi:hypothetical protein